ncbi:MAG: glucose-6-phosphate isomerase [Leucobacter sp.]
MNLRVLPAATIESRPEYSRVLGSLVADEVASRLFARDASLWGSEAEAEASIRLGWTDFAGPAEETVREVASLRAALGREGVDRIILCGMGGSSLAPAVITRNAGVALEVIDTTHPAAIRRALAGDLSRTAVVVSSKSGSTIETRSHLAAFDHAFRDAGIDPSGRLVIVTDPGSPLETDSRDAGRRVFLADPNVGGRFSALTAFGLVPAGLAGADTGSLVASAAAVRDRLASNSPSNPALVLATSIFVGLPEKYILGVHSTPAADWGLGAWIEQLVAESTGKNGRGILPIALPRDAYEFVPSHTPPQLLPVLSDSNERDKELDSAPAAGMRVEGSLGAQMLLWEVATAVLGRLMGIDPFNQPDVESAKVAAREALASPPQDLATPETPDPSAVLAAIGTSVPQGGYVAIQAFVDPGAASAESLRELRERLAARLGTPVALGWGPSYLHSTGQLHKGGPPLGAFLQVLDLDPPTVAIPGSDSGFSELIAAQARGDRNVLAQRGRPVHVLAFNDVQASLSELLAQLKGDT